jgi:hypothetical protein
MTAFSKGQVSVSAAGTSLPIPLYQHRVYSVHNAFREVMMAKLYECTNEECILGVKENPGYFTGGITAAQNSMKTGKSEEEMEEGKDYGEGVCPECGKPGEVVEEFVGLIGEDEFEGRHEEAGAAAEAKIAELKERHSEGQVSDEDYAIALAGITAEAQEKVESG